MPPKIVCIARGSDDVESAFKKLDESQVQLLYTRFPVGTGTFQRNKFIYVIFIGPNCSIVKRGKGIAEINNFKNCLHGAAGISTTEKSSLDIAFLIQQMRKVFVTDTGNFSLDKIQEEYKRCIREQGRKMHQDPPPPKPVSRPVEEDDDADEMISLTSTQLHNLPSIPCEIDDNERKVLDALHTELGPLNWVTFEANPIHLTLAGAGNGGIFELVRNLPETKWLFGLFRITLGQTDERVSRLIFFQWIGSKLRVVRQGPTTGIFPKMATILSPFEYEIYLVGTHDLNSQAIIHKCRNAFADHHIGSPALLITGNVLRGAKEGLRRVELSFTEEEYQTILEEERRRMDLNFDFIHPKRRRGSQVGEGNGKTTNAGGGSKGNGSESGLRFDVEETLSLINQTEGGLVWGIFEVQ